MSVSPGKTKKAAFGFFVLVVAACRREEPLPSVAEIKEEPAAVVDTTYLTPAAIGNPVTGHPWIAQVNAVDLDRDGLMDVIACEAQEGKVLWLRQVQRGHFEEIALAEHLPAPVHVEVADMNHTGHSDILVSCMGAVFPNNDKIGSIVILENNGQQHFTPHVVLENIARVTDVRAADFNGDGQLDLIAAEFGYDQGEVRLMERVGQWEFKSRILLNLPGTINVLATDFNGDGKCDVAAVVSQQYEEIFYFENDGVGNFSKKIIWGSTNEDYASSNISLCDLNRDGRPDILYTNGDGFGPSLLPGPRPWHGVQWLENVGSGNFRFHRIGDQPGAYSPVGVDLDGDGNNDVVAVSTFNSWDKPGAVSMIWYKNDGRMSFTPHILAYEPIQLLTVAAADFDGNGQQALVTGAFFFTPPYDRTSRITLWRRTNKP
ncbi:MAG TPA: VCBS repeat-containing protein [Opitutaceae bacterium]|nr:VCBS repeat-containing protein [Opitutaceae bacterium]